MERRRYYIARGVLLGLLVGLFGLTAIADASWGGTMETHQLTGGGDTGGGGHGYSSPYSSPYYSPYGSPYSSPASTNYSENHSTDYLYNSPYNSPAGPPPGGGGGYLTPTSGGYYVDGGGYYTQQCTSSGKGGQTCNWVYVPFPPVFYAYAQSPATAPASSATAAFPATVSIDAAPLLVHNGGSSTITWTSENTESCTVTGPSFSESGTSGSKVADNITEQRTYTLECVALAGGTVADTVTVSIIPVWQEL